MTIHWHNAYLELRTAGDRLADWLSLWTGSWPSVTLHTVWFVAWWYLHLDVDLLTLIVSLEAIYLCVFLLMSGNRQSDRDRHHAEADYQTNLAAKGEIETLQRHLSRIENDKLDELLRLARAGST